MSQLSRRNTTYLPTARNGTSLDEARTAYAEQICENPEDYIGGDWKRLNDNAPLKVTDYDGNGNSKTQTCAEWIAEALQGKHFSRCVCSGIELAAVARNGTHRSPADGSAQILAWALRLEREFGY